MRRGRGKSVTAAKTRSVQARAILTFSKGADGRVYGWIYEVLKLMAAKIYRPAKTAMQSGKAKTLLWVLEFDPEVPRSIDPILGYTSSSDMKQQLRLTFETMELAEAYAKREGIEYRVILPKEPARQTVSYTDNFRFSRMQPWTH
jgi:hypothetical protein